MPPGRKLGTLIGTQAYVQMWKVETEFCGDYFGPYRRSVFLTPCLSINHMKFPGFILEKHPPQKGIFYIYGLSEDLWSVVPHASTERLLELLPDEFSAAFRSLPFKILVWSLR